MALSTTTNLANRYGLNVEIYAMDDTIGTDTPLMTIDFANVSDISLSGDRVWATGGQDHANRIGFNNPMEGTMTLSTQIMTAELLNLVAGADMEETLTNTIVFENTSNAAPKYYQIKAETVWQDADGSVYDETLTFHKVSPQKAYNISYSGEGDPTSVDVVFDLLQNADGKILTVTKADQT